MPVRKLKKSHQNVTGRYYSTLLNRLVQFDSILERDFILLLDLHPAVRWFAEQPLRISIGREPGIAQIYVPDFLIRFHGGDFLGWATGQSWIVETKYRSDLKANWSKIRPKLRAGVREARIRNFRFKIITECRMATADLANARFLRRYLNAAVAPEAIENVVRIVHARKRTTINNLTSELQHSCQDLGHADVAIWVTIARRLIVAEFDKAFGPQTAVWVR